MSSRDVLPIIIQPRWPAGLDSLEISIGPKTLLINKAKKFEKS